MSGFQRLALVVPVMLLVAWAVAAAVNAIVGGLVFVVGTLALLPVATRRAVDDGEQTP